MNVSVGNITLEDIRLRKYKVCKLEGCCKDIYGRLIKKDEEYYILLGDAAITKIDNDTKIQILI